LCSNFFFFFFISVLIGGEGDDHLQVTVLVPEYVDNAPVIADGGPGFNTLVLIGTEANDIFVITKDSLCGAGRFATFVLFQQFMVLGDAGDDHIYVLGTARLSSMRVSGMTLLSCSALITLMRTESLCVFLGGLGSDKVTIVPERIVGPIACNPLRGHSGLIEHSIASDLPEWNSILIDGISAQVKDNTSGIWFEPVGGLSLYASSTNLDFPASQNISFKLTFPVPFGEEVLIKLAEAKQFGNRSQQIIMTPEVLHFREIGEIINVTVTAQRPFDSGLLNVRTYLTMAALPPKFGPFASLPALPTIPIDIFDAYLQPLMSRGINGPASQLVAI
jgi:hypothetical protein